MDKEKKLEAIKDMKRLKMALGESNKSFTPVYEKGHETDWNEGSLENGVLAAASDKQSILINGIAGVNGAIPGITNIWLIVDPGIYYDFTIKVDGACPKGKWDNHMTFTDRSGDTYHLRIYSTSRKEHYVNYHSPDGNITRITWDI